MCQIYRSAACMDYSSLGPETVSGLDTESIVFVPSIVVSRNSGTCIYLSLKIRKTVVTSTMVRIEVQAIEKPEVN